MAFLVWLFMGVAFLGWFSAIRNMRRRELVELELRETREELAESKSDRNDLRARLTVRSSKLWTTERDLSLCVGALRRISARCTFPHSTAENALHTVGAWEPETTSEPPGPAA